MVIKGTKKSFIIFVLFLLEILATFFSIEYLQYYDEFLGILGICYLPYNYIINRKNDKLVFTIISFILFMSFTALTSNFILHFENNWVDVVNDAFTFIKPFAIFALFYKWTENEADLKSLLKLLIPTIRFLAVILGVVIILSYFFETDLAIYDQWAPFPWLKEFIFFVGHPSLLAIYIASLIPILLLDNRLSKNSIFIGVFLLGMFLTQSGLGVLAIFLFMILEFFFVLSKRIKWYHIILIFIGVIIVGYTEVKEYLLNSNAARAILFGHAFIVAKKYFPLGTGFATYGGAVAAKSYSKLYTMYKFYNYWGMGKNEDGFYLHDSYFPMVIAQFGIIGTSVYLLFYYKIYKTINHFKSKQLKVAAIYIFLIVVGSNFGQGGFSSSAGMLLLSNLALIFNCNKYY